MKHIFKSLAFVALMISSMSEASILTQQERMLLRESVAAEYAQAPVEIKEVAKIARIFALDMINGVDEIFDVLIENPHLVSDHKGVLQEKSQQTALKLQASAAQIHVDRQVLEQYACDILMRTDLEKFDSIAAKWQNALIELNIKFHAIKTSEDVKKLKKSFELIKEEVMFVLDVIN